MGNESDAIKWLQDVVRIPTILGNETEVCLVIKKILDDVGIESELVPLDGDEKRCSLVATLRGSEPGKVLGFAGHIDVVPLGDEPWSVEPFGAEIIDDKMYGRGSCDMKCGLMAAVAAMVNLKKNNHPLAGAVKLFATAGEESGLLGAKYLRENGYADDVDAMIIGEPTSGITFHSHKGVLRVKITADIPQGTVPGPGESALDYLLRYLEKYDAQFDLADFLESQASSVNPPTISLNMIGNKINVEEAEITRVKPKDEEPDLTHWEAVIEVRTVPQLNQPALLEKLEQLMRETESEIPGLTLELEVFVDNAPVSTPAKHPFVKLVRKKFGALFSSPVDLPGCTDASEFIQLRDPGDPNDLPIVIAARAYILKAHKTDEFTRVSEYLETMDSYENIIKEYLKPTAEK